MDLLNRKYLPYTSFGIVSVLFTVSLFIFKPFIKMLELYTLFVRVNPKSLVSALDFGGDGFILSSAVPITPYVNFYNYPLFFDIFYCTMGIIFIVFSVFFVSNIFISFCLGLITIISFALYSIFLSHTQDIWIPIIWPMIIQTFLFLTFLTLKISLKQTQQLHTIKLFGYSINMFPDSIPFIKNLVKQPEKIDATMCCFRIKTPQTIITEYSEESIVYKINEIFQIIIDGCLKYGGIIDKTSNNNIIAYWIGKNNALNSVYAAMEINEKLKNNPIKISCGIATEQSIFAILGSEHFSNYTLIGTISETATRIENACVFHNANILISDKTFESIKEKITSTFKGSITLHGIHSKVDFYEPENIIKENKSCIERLKEELIND